MRGSGIGPTVGSRNNATQGTRKSSGQSQGTCQGQGQVGYEGETNSRRSSTATSMAIIQAMQILSHGSFGLAAWRFREQMFPWPN